MAQGLGDALRALGALGLDEVLVEPGRGCSRRCGRRA